MSVITYALVGGLATVVALLIAAIDRRLLKAQVQDKDHG